MSVEIASAYVSLSANTSTIPKDVRKALGQAESGADRSGQSIGKKMSSGLGKALKVGGLAAGATAATAIGTSLTKGFQRLDAIEQAKTKFEALGYTAKQQSGLMDDITASVKGTAFATSDAADAAAMALAGGIKPGKELTGVLKTVGDSASFANKGFSEVAPIFTQAINRGKVMGDTLARLEDNAIPATQALAKSMGKTAEEIQDMASKGEISFEDLQKAMDGTIGGQALKAGETFQGSLANIGAAMGRLGETILKGPFNAAPGVFSKVSDGIDVLNEKLGGTIELFSTGDFNGDIASKLGVDEDSAVVDRILSAREAIEKLSGTVQLFFTGDFNGSIRERLGVEEDSKLVDDILNIRDVFVDWGERVGNVFRELGELGKRLAPSFGSIAASLGKATAKVSAATWEALLRIVEALVPVLEKVLVPAFELLAKTMEDHPRLVETLVFAFAGLKVIKLVAGPLKAIGGIARGASGGFKLLSGALGVGKAAGKGGKIGSALLHIAGGAKSANPFVAKLGGAATKAVGGLTLFGRAGGVLSKAFGPVSKVLGGIVGKLGMKGLLGVVGKVALKFVPFIGWIWTAYEALKWFFTKTETGKKVFEGLKNVLSNVWNWIRDTFVAGFEWAGDKLSTMWDGITSAWGTAWQGITGFLSTTWDGMKAAWEAVGQPVVDFIKGAWDVLWTALEYGFYFIVGLGALAWKGIKATWDAVGQPVVDFVKGAFETLWFGIKRALDWIGSGWNWLWQSLQNAYNTYIVPVIDWIKGAFESMKNALIVAWDWVKQKWSDLWQGVQNIYHTYVVPVVDWIVTKFNEMRDKVVGAWNWVKTKIQEFASWLGGKMTEIGNTIMGLYDQYVAPWVDKIRGGIDRVVGFFSGLKDRILGAVSGAKDWLLQSGRWVIEGLINGMKEMLGKAVDTIKNIGGTVVNAGKEALGIGSPSKIFRQYGAWVGEGLVLGIESMGKKVEKATRGMADRVAGVDMPTVQVNAQVNDQGLNVEATASQVAPAAASSPAPSSRLEGGAPPAAQQVEQGTQSFEASSEAVSASVQATLTPAVQQADLSMTGFGANVQATATGVVTPQWQGMANNVAMAANGVIAPAFGAVQAGLSNTGARFAQQTTGVMTPMWNAMGANVQRVRQAVTDPAMAGIRSALTATGAHFTNSVNGTINPVWNAMGTNVQRVWTGTVNPAFNAIAGGLRNTVTAFSNGATGIANQWNRVRRATADPVNFAIQRVFNDGVVGMWNSASDLLGTKKMAKYNYVAKYATGGYVSGPGGPTEDKIPAMLSDGEYVIKAAAVDKIGMRNLDALNSGRMDFAANAFKDKTFKKVAIKRAAGGPVKGEPAWAALKRGYDWARSRNGRPYVWGGSADGSGGADCSGFMSGIADVILGGSGKRQWGTGNFNDVPQRSAWRTGLGKGFAVGIVNGGPWGGHTAGTIGGVDGMPATNVESGGTNSRMKFGTSDAAGANDPQFSHQYTMKIIDGKFVPGLGSSGGGVDMTAMVEEAMAASRKKMNDAVASWNRPGLVNTVPRQVASKLGGAAEKKINKKAAEMSSVPGGLVSSAGVNGSNRQMGQQMAARVGWTGSEWDALNKLWTAESQWNNLAQNPTSTAYGIPQFLDSTWASVGGSKTSDARKQIQYGIKYIQQRPDYGTPSKAWALWNSRSPHWYDQGGYLQPGTTLTQNDTGKPEPVFTHKQWQILKGNIMSAAQAGDLKKLQINLGVVANGLQQAVAKLDWQEIFGAASKAFNDKFFEDQAADVRSVFGIPDPDSIPAVKAYAEFRENEKKLNEEQAQAAKDSREAATRADSAADKISGAPVPVKAKSESVSVGSQVARTGALVSRALANPNPVTVGAAAKSGGDTIQFIVRNEEAAWSEYRKFQAKNSRGRVGAR